ncbi:MAG: hypothetical protein FJ009_18300 [Chloroflexi bacterium]|nr:hypothetical protein [Chloroflexota bacterium]
MGVNHTTTLERQMAQHIAQLAFQHLTRSNLVREQNQPMEDGSPLIYAWPLDERVVLIVNPLRIKNIDHLTSRRFEHHLATIMQGRRVVVTNHRGIFVQVAYWPEPHRELVARPLDLNEQKTPLHVPIGMTARGAPSTSLRAELWLSLAEMDAVLIGGARRLGKTNLLHGWIAALLQGKEARVVLFDGKGGVEFNRYSEQARCKVVTDKLAPVLGELFAEMNRRFDILKVAKVANLAEYNDGRGAGERIERIVLIVDELAYALQEPGVEDVLVDLIARGGAVGIHPVLATQRPSSDVITPRLKGNLVTRIALPVPSRADSMVILDRAGAESIAKTPGRLLIAHGARLIEAQAFRVDGEQLAVSNEKQLPASTRLSAREQRIAQIAVERGWFKIRDVHEATGESPNYLVDVARKWQLLGWLTPVQRNERGHQLGRRVTPELIALLASEPGKPANEVNLA